MGAVAPASLLTALFATAAVALALKLGSGDCLVIAWAPCTACAVGVGGGTLGAPVLSLFAIRRAIGAVRCSIW
jgi:hypothetical protein